MNSILWFRRDLRLHDHPALSAACADGSVLPVFVIDPALWGPSGAPRRAWLTRSLAALSASLDGRLHLASGDPVEVLPRLAAEVAATRVHVSADFGPYGRRRDAAVVDALAARGVEWVATGSPYAVSPGRVRKPDGTPYQVFTPWSKAWQAHGWRGPARLPESRDFLSLGISEALPVADCEVDLPPIGEQAAARRWAAFLDDGLAGYASRRDLPGVDGTTRMSAHLRWGEIHPRTMLADLAEAELARPELAEDVHRLRTELAWRDFYADVLFHHPRSARDYLREQFAAMEYDAPGAAFDAWRAGRTGFPIVDAGMRQLLATGWMHNRVRMIVASFLVKDLHVEWQHGARHFMAQLVDGDLASNSHGWQWTAGSGTDAAPYFRVFNPTSQGRKFDPGGDYVRRWVPELVDALDPHDPGPLERSAAGYPEPIVDHAAERREALARYQALRA